MIELEDFRVYKKLYGPHFTLDYIFYRSRLPTRVFTINRISKIEEVSHSYALTRRILIDPMIKAKYDAVGVWSEVKLEIIREYASKYSRIMTNEPRIRKHIYVDAFAGAGLHISKATGGFIPGSPLNALAILPPFSEFHLIDIDGDRAKQLRQMIGPRTDVEIYDKDANDVLLKRVFPLCRYEHFNRALCLLDPYSLTVDWKVIETAGKMKSVEIFFNFMIMDANMNVFKKHPDRVALSQVSRMDKAWGDHSWREVAYRKDRGLFGDIESKVTNEVIAEAFRARLKDVAGFQYVPAPMPMRNDQGGIVYYLYFASPNPTGNRIVTGIFKKYRERGIR